MSSPIAPPAAASQKLDRTGGDVFHSSVARTVAVLLALSIGYGLLVSLEPHRALWFDELITYYIARAPTLAGLFDLAHRLDLNPLPVDYVLTRLSMTILGDSPMAVRLPSVVAFYIASVMVFLYVRRKAGDGFAAFSVIILWYSPVFRYATEARPYAFLGMFFASLLLFWDIATTAERRAGALWGVAASNAGLMMIHAFAPLSLVPFLVAEALRYRTRRKPDYALWLALLLPALLVVLYLPAARVYSPVIFPIKFQAALRKIPIFFLHVFGDMGSGMFAALLAAILAPAAIGRAPRSVVEEKSARLEMTDVAMIAILVLNPVLLILVLMPRHGPFWDRYCLTTTMAIYIALAICVARRLHFHQLAGYCAAAVLVCVLATEQVVLPWLHHSDTQTAGVLTQVEPELPLVTASGLTFLEMDHSEDMSLVSRIYYLRDRSAAIQYAHATLFEDLTPFDLLKRYFPIRGNVEQYLSFTRRYRQFLVLGTYDYPEDWLLRKLAADGAKLVPIGYYDIPYKDHTIYRVTLPGTTLGERTGADRGKQP
jgi:hypothetical protein